MRRKMESFSYNSLFTGLTVWFDQSTENRSIARLIRVGCRMLYSSKIHNIGYIWPKQTPLKTPETLKKKFATVSLQTKNLAIVIKVVRQFKGILQFWGNYNLEHSVLKTINVRVPTTIEIKWFTRSSIFRPPLFK